MILALPHLIVNWSERYRPLDYAMAAILGGSLLWVAAGPLSLSWVPAVALVLAGAGRGPGYGLVAPGAGYSSPPTLASALAILALGVSSPYEISRARSGFVPAGRFGRRRRHDGKRGKA